MITQASYKQRRITTSQWPILRTFWREDLTLRRMKERRRWDGRMTQSSWIFQGAICLLWCRLPDDCYFSYSNLCRVAALTSNNEPDLYDNIADSFNNLKETVNDVVSRPEVKDNMFYILMGK